MSGELAEYEVTVNGSPTTMQLNEADAKRLGGVRVGVATVADDAPVHAKARQPANKSRGSLDVNHK